MLRFEVTTNDWVGFAPSRDLRAHEFRRKAEGAPAKGNGPFCSGHKAQTPGEIDAVRGPGVGVAEWKIRVVSRKHLAPGIEESSQRRLEERLFRSRGGCGAHEAIADASPYDRTLALQPAAELLKRGLLWLHQALGNPDLNLTIAMAPRFEDGAYLLWHVGIPPRPTTPDGLELGSGMAINTMPPEETAAFLRTAADAERLHPREAFEKFPCVYCVKRTSST